MLEVGKREGLHEVRDRREAPRARIGKLEARADDRGLAVHCPEGLRTLDAGCVRGLEEDDVDRGEVGVVQHRVMAEPDHDAAEELSHLGMRLTDEHPRHCLQ